MTNFNLDRDHRVFENEFKQECTNVIMMIEVHERLGNYGM